MNERRLRLMMSENVVNFLKEFLPYYQCVMVSQVAQLTGESFKIVKSAANELQSAGFLRIQKIGKQRDHALILRSNGVSLDFIKIRALWILIFAMKDSNIEYHTPGSKFSGVLIHFIFGGKHYEIHHCPEDGAAICNMYLKVGDESYQNAKEDIPQRIILVENSKDISKIRGTHIYAFAMAEIDGNIRLFQGKG